MQCIVEITKMQSQEIRHDAAKHDLNVGDSTRALRLTSSQPTGFAIRHVAQYGSRRPLATWLQAANV